MAVTPVLRRFDAFVYRDMDPEAEPPDRRQVPAEARVDFYQQGATVVPGSPVAVPYEYFEDIAIEVWHFGTLQVDDDVLVHGDASKQLRVTALEAERRLVWVRNETSVTQIVVNPGDRLVRLNDRPIAHQDPTGAATSGDAYVESDAQGRAWCYVLPLRFDYVVSGAGLATRVFVDAEGAPVMRT